MISIYTEIAIIAVLIVFNGVFALSEIAVVTSRKLILQQKAEEGLRGYKIAHQLASSPGVFLSTIQIGITLVGVLAGAFSGATIARKIEAELSGMPVVGEHAGFLAIMMIVVTITLLSVIFGELVPKRIALNNPEKISASVAVFMRAISFIFSPIVRGLDYVTELVLKMLRVPTENEQVVTDEEVLLMIEHGTKTGHFETTEREMIEEIFDLSDKTVQHLMIPRMNIVCLNIKSTKATLKRIITEHADLDFFPVCRHDIDTIVGVVNKNDILVDFARGETKSLKAYMQSPLYLPERVSPLWALERFRKENVFVAFAVDEFGGVSGMVTLTGILDEIIGADDIADDTEKLKDGTIRIKGITPIDRLDDIFGKEFIGSTEKSRHSTVAGLMLDLLGHIPAEGEKVVYKGFTFKIRKMAANRIDSIEIKPSRTRLPARPEKSGDR
ncbi:MAG: hemolysin family protein [Spirochaetota bacterium]